MVVRPLRLGRAAMRAVRRRKGNGFAAVLTGDQFGLARRHRAELVTGQESQDQAPAKTACIFWTTPNGLIGNYAPPSAPAPGDGCPDALVQIIPGDFGNDLEACDRARDLDPAREEPANR